MTIRYYLADVIGTGATRAAAFRPATEDLLPTVRQVYVDGRANAAVGGGRMLVAIDVTPAQHATLIADPRITYLPIEDAANAPLAPSDAVSAIPVAKRNTISAIAETMHIPLQGIGLSDPIRFFLRRMRIRLLMRQYLGPALDFTEGLDTLISAIAPARRQAINDRLTQAGFSSRDAGVLGTDTVRAGIIKMVLEREETDNGG